MGSEKFSTRALRILKAVKEAILLFSHGSVLCGAGENLRRIAAHMEARGDAPIVEAGYLNYSEPVFEQAFARCVERGAERVVITPYFLVAGKFVQVDLPRAIEKVLPSYPGVEARLASAMKRHTFLADAILNCARRAQPPGAWRDIWNTAPRFCRDSDQCPLHGTERCPATSNIIPSAAPVSSPQSIPLTPGPRALLVMVHGSPRPESNVDMYAVVDEVRERGEYDIVQVGFMECNEPSIPEAIEACVAEGAESVIAVPYFLHTGNHVADDLPTLLEEGQRRYPEVEFAMGDYVGHDEAVMDVLRDRALEAVAVAVAS